jgi:hypothetical protein
MWQVNIIISFFPVLLNMGREMHQSILNMGREMNQSILNMGREMHQSILNMGREMHQSILNMGREMHQSILNMGREMHQSILNMGREMHQSTEKKGTVRPTHIMGWPYCASLLLRMCGYLFPHAVRVGIHLTAYELRSKFRNKFPIQGHRARTVQCIGSNSSSNTGLVLDMFVLESVAPVRLLHILLVLKFIILHGK